MSRSPIEMWSESSGVHGTLHVRVDRPSFDDKVLKRHYSATLESKKPGILNIRAHNTTTQSHRTRSAQFAQQAHKSTIAQSVPRTAPPSALLSQQPCRRTLCPMRAAAVALSAHMHCHTTPLLRHRLHAGAPSDRRSHGRAARWRPPLRPPRRPSVPHTHWHCREPWPLTAPSAPDCRALTPALPPCFSVMIAWRHASASNIAHWRSLRCRHRRH